MSKQLFSSLGVLLKWQTVQACLLSYSQSIQIIRKALLDQTNPSTSSASFLTQWPTSCGVIAVHWCSIFFFPLKHVKKHSHGIMGRMVAALWWWQDNKCECGLQKYAVSGPGGMITHWKVFHLKTCFTAVIWSECSDDGNDLERRQIEYVPVHMRLPTPHKKIPVRKQRQRETFM